MSQEDHRPLYPRAKKRVVDRVSDRIREFRKSEFAGGYSPQRARELADAVEMMLFDLQPYRKDRNEGREYDTLDERVIGVDITPRS